MLIEKNDWKKILLIFLGTFISAVNTNAILIPHQLLSGGITGLAIFVHLIKNWNTAILILLFNIPIFILGYKLINKKFIILSLIGTGSFSFFLSLTQQIQLPIHDTLSAILLGGVLGGLGLGIVFRGHGSTGGTDILAKIIHRYFGFSIGSTMFAFNIIVISLSIYTFGFDLSISTLATMFISSYTMNYVIEGINHRRCVIIISAQYNEIAEAILKQLKRGVTKIPGEGVYTKQPRPILYCTVTIQQVARLKDIIRDIDPTAFVTITETAQVFGKGFFDIKNI
ncbi:MAG: YitT family protein [Epulopiscium sp.]|nr:YitT family protein [Candidatus Epulonipiscium sp.]